MSDVMMVGPGAGSVAEPRSDAELIVRARELFDRQHRNRPNVRARGARERIARLEDLRAAILAHRPALHQAMAADLGKPYVEVEAIEIQPALREIAHAARHLARWMRPRRVPHPLLLAGSRSEIHYEPKGVVLVLGAWNFPFGLVVNPLIAAVAAGNCVIARPSEKAPRTAAALEALVASAFPEDEAAVVGGGVPVADALLELPFDHFFFTGSGAIGRKVMVAAARHLAGVTLELGGKCPAIVDETADVDRAADRIVRAKFANAGQTCIAPDYALVHESLARRFVARAVDTVARFYGASEDARRRSADFCRIVDEHAVLRLAALVEAGVAAGARIEIGGRSDPAERYFAPTILSGVAPDSPLMEEEIFGPVLPVRTFASLGDAIAEVDARPRPLGLYLFTGSRRAARAVLQRTSAGGTVVNEAAIHYFNPDLPFGGVGPSGFGCYHGWFGFRTLSHERAVLRQGRAGLIPLIDPPYGRRATRLVDLMRRIIR
ncbi:MAG TPA: aldehyde dehydrogenase family protein [Longimicrobiales bacterium]|nr:aldehyde dehydrogenase family protein [Longimicrobiales bacterium]